MLELLELHVLNVGQGLDSSIMQVNSSEVRSEGGGERERGGGGEEASAHPSTAPAPMMNMCQMVMASEVGANKSEGSMMNHVTGLTSFGPC